MAISCNSLSNGHDSCSRWYVHIALPVPASPSSSLLTALPSLCSSSEPTSSIDSISDSASLDGPSSSTCRLTASVLAGLSAASSASSEYERGELHRCNSKCRASVIYPILSVDWPHASAAKSRRRSGGVRNHMPGSPYAVTDRTLLQPYAWWT